ncbi:hypothetical protein [Pseudomonas cichorii]|uniref:hypothetical protein n=1 Tax=Pseudomonas cichorii TaxID=36746 RepID=UPI001910BA4C|nr:hypothetical protein [Pseudomonas cichorii]
MLKRLFVAYLKTFDQGAARKALSSTLVSLLFAIFPVVFFIAWAMLSDWIKRVFAFPWTFNFFGWAWLNELITRFMNWIAETIGVLLISMIPLVFGAFFLWAYLRRNWVFVFLTMRLFKKVTAPFFVFYFSAFLLRFLIEFEFFYSVDHLIADWGMANVLDSGKWIFLITGLTWLLMSYASHKQVEIVKKERLQGKQPPTLLDRLDRMRKAYIKKNIAS